MYDYNKCLQVANKSSEINHQECLEILNYECISRL